MNLTKHKCLNCSRLRILILCSHCNQERCEDCLPLHLRNCHSKSLEGLKARCK